MDIAGRKPPGPHPRDEACVQARVLVLGETGVVNELQLRAGAVDVQCGEGDGGGWVGSHAVVIS